VTELSQKDRERALARSDVAVLLVDAERMKRDGKLLGERELELCAEVSCLSFFLHSIIDLSIYLLACL
jgi:hypothetical protein